MQALIDGDIVAFRCAATAEGLDEWIAIARTNDLIEQIIGEIKATGSTVYLTGKNNFRRQIYPEYKAHRVKPPPQHLEACRQYLIKEWKAIVADGCEADDMLGVQQMSLMDNGDDPEVPFDLRSYICSIDKDLLQIPGKHYNFVKKEIQEVTYMRGLREFYLQLLTGDRADNVFGIRGIGPKKAEALLEGYETEQELFDAVRAQYNNDNQFLMNGKLLWIWRKENDIWNPSHLTENTPLVLDQELESTV